MVAYSFHPQFISPILSGIKAGTVRATGKRRHAQSGETLQLYTGMRTRQCRLIAEAQCQAAVPIRLTFSVDGRHDVVKAGRALFHGYSLDVFAVGDGFTSWPALRAFWREHHPGIDRFEGIWIRWACISGGMLLS